MTGADALVHLPGGQPLQQRQRTRPADLEPLERGHVVHRDRGAGAPRLGRRDGRVELRGPVVTRRRRPLGRQIGPAARRWPRTSAGAPSRRPRGRPRRVRSCRAWNGLDPQVPRRLLGLQRVQDVVDLDEVLRGGLADVVRGELELLEAVHVAAVQVVLGPAVDEQLRRRPWRRRPSGSPTRPRRSRSRRRPGTRPISGPPSGVKEKIPLKPSSTFVPRSAGSSSRHCSQAAAKSSSVNGSIDGMAAVGHLAAVGQVVAGRTGIGRWA